MQIASAPDRPIDPRLHPLRRLIRSIRIARLRLLLGRKLDLGSNVVFGADAVLLPPSYARFGNNVYVGRQFHLETNLVVGDDVLISSRVAIVGNDHRYGEGLETIVSAGRLPPATVRIEGENLIGFGAIIVGAVTIGRGTVVGAGSVVVNDLPPGKICVGVPAAPIKDR